LQRSPSPPLYLGGLLLKGTEGRGGEGKERRGGDERKERGGVKRGEGKEGRGREGRGREGVRPLPYEEKEKSAPMKGSLC